MTNTTDTVRCTAGNHYVAPSEMLSGVCLACRKAKGLAPYRSTLNSEALAETMGRVRITVQAAGFYHANLALASLEAQDLVEALPVLRAIHATMQDAPDAASQTSGAYMRADLRKATTWAAQQAGATTKVSEAVAQTAGLVLYNTRQAIEALIVARHDALNELAALVEELEAIAAQRRALASMQAAGQVA